MDVTQTMRSAPSSFSTSPARAPFPSIRRNWPLGVHWLPWTDCGRLWHTLRKPLYRRPGPGSPVRPYRDKFKNDANLSGSTAASLDLSKADAKTAVDAAVSAIADATAKGEDGSTDGFGKFKI